MTLYNRVRRLCNDQGIDISNLGEHLPDANVSKSTISGWKKGAVPRAAIIKAMADYFDVSTEYIISGKGTPADSTGAKSAASNHNPMVIINNGEKLSEQEVALLKLYRGLDVIKRAKLLAYASEL